MLIGMPHSSQTLSLPHGDAPPQLLSGSRPRETFWRTGDCVQCPVQPSLTMAVIRSQIDDLTNVERLVLRKMGNQFGHPHRPEYCNPEPRGIYRCGFRGCVPTLNPPGLERAVTAHYRKVRRPLVCAANITIHRRDKKAHIFQIQWGPYATADKYPVGGMEDR